MLYLCDIKPRIQRLRALVLAWSHDINMLQYHYNSYFALATSSSSAAIDTATAAYAVAYSTVELLARKAMRYGVEQQLLQLFACGRRALTQR